MPAARVHRGGLVLEHAHRVVHPRLALRPLGSHSHTRPSSYSSHESQVPHGVGPPAQFWVVPSRIR